MPFEIVCQHRPAQDEPYLWVKPADEEREEGKGHGDGKRWTVDLGPPFLSLTMARLQDQEFQKKAVAILSTWIQWDRMTLLRLQQRVGVLQPPLRWSTNSDGFVPGTLMAWSWEPGANLLPLYQAFSPVLMNLGVHLQWQDNVDAYILIPVLQWLRGLNQPAGRRRCVPSWAMHS